MTWRKSPGEIIPPLTNIRTKSSFCMDVFYNFRNSNQRELLLTGSPQACKRQHKQGANHGQTERNSPTENSKRQQDQPDQRIEQEQQDRKWPTKNQENHP